MNILVATSEAVPFAKTGGLADVCAALPVALQQLGHRAVVILPAYRQALECGCPVESTGIEFSVPIGTKSVDGELLRSSLPDSDVTVYLVRQDRYYDRPALYGEGGKDYIDNCERFVFFCRAVLQAIELLDLNLDVVHANDWHTGLIPAYLKIEYQGVPAYEQIAALFTIHNLRYQGRFWHWDMLLTGLDWKYFNWQQMEFFGDLNLLKTGLVFADSLSTVSPRYAEEIQTPEQGCHLEGVLQHRGKVLTGILNGVDYRQWHPRHDPHLPVNYGPDDVAKGKAACKAALQQEVGLPPRPQVPLIGFVGRLDDQKGVDLIAGVMSEWVDEIDAQWVILGTGDSRLEKRLGEIAQRHSSRVAVQLAFSDPLAHRIEAGADIFLMPSKYEPCGLSQMYSLKYGTVPVVRATGGLADTITDTTPATLADGSANGFCFVPYEQRALAETLQRACRAFADPAVWPRLIENGMRQDWSWTRSAKEYVQLYQKTSARLKQAIYT